MSDRSTAKRYAHALLDVAVKEKADLQDIERQLTDFLALVKQHELLEHVLMNPVVPAPRKRAAVEALTTRAGVAPVLAKLLALLAERDRLVVLPELVSAYRERMFDHQKVVRAQVTTAAALSADRAKTIQEGLARITGRTVTLDTRVDPSIIGGVVARIGSTVYDGSVARQLEKMKERLVEGT